MPDTPTDSDFAGPADRRLHDHPVLGPLPPAAAVTFTFDGRPVTARAGEPIAAALVAAGVRIWRTMPRSGEARGGYCMVGRCSDCLVVVDGWPNLRACLTPVRDGMRVATQHGLGEDVWEAPDSQMPEERDPPSGERAKGGMSQPQVVVVGGGPAGLGAAIAAARAGARVTLLDEQPALGGQLRYRIVEVADARDAPPRLPAQLRAELVAEAEALRVELRPGALAWGIFAGNVLGVVDGQSSSDLAAEAIVLATGSTDLPFPFVGGSLPGVFTARAVQILLNQHRVRPGRRFAVLGAGPEAAEVAADVRLAGGDVVVTADPARVSSLTAGGAEGVRAVVVAGVRHAVDVVVVAVGRRPDAALALMAGCAFGFAPALGGHVPILDERLRTTVPGLLMAGDAAGAGEARTALVEGRFAGTSAAALLGLVDADMLAAARIAYEAAADDRVAARRRLEPSYVQTYE